MMKIEQLVLFGITAGLAYWLFRWLRNVTPSPDPWDIHIDEQIRSHESVPICHRCLTPAPTRGWFCPECGASVGDYNNYMPFVYIFPEGEILRTGVTAPLRPSFLIVGGYVLFAIASYGFFAPFYWYRLYRNLSRHRTIGAEPQTGQPGDLTAGESD